jgi:hypothetical protein
MHQRCSNYALINLLFGLCRSMWIIELFVNLPSPCPGALTHPSSPKMLWVRKCTPTLSPFLVFIFGFTVESIKKLGGVSTRHHLHWTTIITKTTLHHITIATIIIIGKNKGGRWQGSTFSSLWFLWLWLWASQARMACAQCKAWAWSLMWFYSTCMDECVHKWMILYG